MLPIIIIAGIAAAIIFVIAILILVILFFLHPWALVTIVVVPTVAYVILKMYKPKKRRR